MNLESVIPHFWNLSKANLPVYESTTRLTNGGYNTENGGYNTENRGYPVPSLRKDLKCIAKKTTPNAF